MNKRRCDRTSADGTIGPMATLTARALTHAAGVG
jgi:hypothetical protein